jgi:hypothetical protein
LAPRWQGFSSRSQLGRCSHDGMDGPAFSGRRMIARSPFGDQPGGRTR